MRWKFIYEVRLRQWDNNIFLSPAISEQNYRISETKSASIIAELWGAKYKFRNLLFVATVTKVRNL